MRFYKAARRAVNIFRQHYARDHIPGSARVSRAGFSVALKQSFLKAVLRGSALSFRTETERREVREPDTASPGRRGDRYPIIALLGAAAGWDDPSVLCLVSEWASPSVWL